MSKRGREKLDFFAQRCIVEVISIPKDIGTHLLKVHLPWQNKGNQGG
jgi:hypothetical protein